MCAFFMTFRITQRGGRGRARTCWEAAPCCAPAAGNELTDLKDGRDIPGGCLLTGTASPHVVVCPFPGAPATPSLTWINPPDGSQSLTDPKDLAIALAASSEARLPAGQRWPQQRATP